MIPGQDELLDAVQRCVRNKASQDFTGKVTVTFRDGRIVGLEVEKLLEGFEVLREAWG